MNFPGETPDKVELKHFLESLQDTMDQKPYEVMLRGELLYAALQLAPRNLDDIPPIADTTTGPRATRAALRAQVEHENKRKQESKEALVLLEPHRVRFGDIDAAESRIEIATASRYTCSTTLPFDVRLSANVQGAEGQASQPT
eukprot:754584-Pleurochrysis_carterae.AAC.1